VSALIRLPEEQGAWSAFWLFGETGLPENDVFEHCGGEQYVNVTHHWGYGYDNPELKKHTEWNKRRNINPNEWNLYEIEISPYKTIYRINNKVVRSMKRGTSSDRRHILLTCGWGDYCGGNSPDAYMEVKWLTLESYGIRYVKP
jgi:beta-glucanase (GH16 family)